MRTAFWATLVLLPALPPVPSALAQASGPIVVRSLVGRSGRVLADTMGVTYEVPFSAGRAFSAIAAVYADLEIPADVRDSAQLQVGNQGFDARRRLAGRRMSASLDCGQGFTGLRADAYRIDLSIVTFITATGTESASIRTVLLGTAVNVTEGANREQACYTTGDLERRIHELVMKEVGSRK